MAGCSINRRLVEDDASENAERLFWVKEKRHGHGNVRGSPKFESKDPA